MLMDHCSEQKIPEPLTSPDTVLDTLGSVLMLDPSKAVPYTHRNTGWGRWIKLSLGTLGI
ncbi:unnamed protein product, partial [Chrysoparadoxa australica]